MSKTETSIEGILLGFDFGLRHIGVAVSQTITKTANPLITLSAKNGAPYWSRIDKLIEDWQPAALVVGLPLNMDGSEQPITQKAKRFARQLEQRLQLPVRLVDERLTTVAAKADLFAQGGFQALSKDRIDQHSAKLILEAFLVSL